jgi:hypothetical protein
MKNLFRIGERNYWYGSVSRSAGCFGCYVTCPNAVSSRVIHLVFHRHQHNCSSSLDSIKLVYQHPLERPSAATDRKLLPHFTFLLEHCVILLSNLEISRDNNMIYEEMQVSASLNATRIACSFILHLAWSKLPLP